MRGLTGFLSISLSNYLLPLYLLHKYYLFPVGDYAYEMNIFEIMSKLTSF